jgi:hypothetical protein
MRSAKPAQDGSFEIAGVRPGAYTLVSSTGTYSDVKGWVDLDVGAAGIDNLVFRLADQFPLRGRVVFQGGDPGGLKVTIQPHGFDNGWLMATSARDGRFAWDRVLPDQYRLILRDIPPGAFVESVRADGKDVDTAGFTPSRAAPIVITLRH